MRRDYLPPVGLFGLAFLLRAGSLHAWPFDGLYGQDAYAYYDYGAGPLRSALRQLQPPPPFYWPPGYLLLMALPSLRVGFTPRLGQVVSSLAGSLAPVLPGLIATVAGSTGGFDTYRWEVAILFRREFVAPVGWLRYRWPNGLYYSLMPLHQYYLSPVLGVLLALGVARTATWLASAGGAHSWR